MLLVGGGSGIVPLVAVVRRLAAGPVPSNASVRLVLAVREVCALEQLVRVRARVRVRVRARVKVRARARVRG